MMEGRQPKFIISGGGTGGHIFPALSIAKELKNQYPEGEFLFIGAEGRMEMDCVPKEGFKIIGLPVKGIDRKHIWKNILVFYRFVKSLWIVRKILKNFKPNVVIGVGGYASGPTLYLAQKMGIPTLIQEQNSYAGVANKWLSKRAKVICVAYPKMERFFPKEKIVLTGNPVRKDFTQLDRIDKKEALQYFGLKEDLPTLFLVGGSLGAGTMNRSVLHSFQRLKSEKVQLLWQCGKYYYANMKEFLRENPCENILLLPFISRMDYAYAVADIILTRAGAGALSELSLVGKPIIMVPSPNVAEDHQTKNALSIVEQGGGMMVKDKDAEEELFPTALQLLNEREKMKSFGEGIQKIALPNATHEIVECIKGLL